MLKSKIEKSFETDPSLRVLFLFDREGAFKDEADALALEGIRVEKFADNFFYLKKKLHTDWVNERVFLYFNFASPHKTGKFLEFPLLDILEANKELVTDDEESFLEEFNLERSQKNLVKKYIKELQYSSVQEVCRPILQSGKLDEESLQRGLISAFLKLNQVSSWEVILAKSLLLGFPEKETEWKRLMRKLSENDLLAVFSKKIKFFFGKSAEVIDQNFLVYLLQKIRYNQITQFIQEPHRDDPYKGLKIKDKSQLTGIFQIIQEAASHPQIGQRFEEGLEMASSTIHGKKLIELYGVESDYGLLTPEMAWILLTSLGENIDFLPQVTSQKLKKISTAHSLSPSLNQAFEFLIKTGEMIQQINSISAYTLNRCEDYIVAYTTDWNRIDTAYRKAIQSHRNIQEIGDGFDLDAYFTLLNKRYNDFLEISNREWLRCLKELKFDYSKIATKKQYDFFQKEIREAEVKTVVVISDALRFEAAKELLGIMHGDDKNVAQMDYALASIPSKTSIGMAQLLPCTDLYFNKGNITNSGISTEGVKNREQILNREINESIAVQYSQIEGLPIKEARELFKAPVVYVYHDVIDSTGDKKPSERRTFSAVDEALQELGKFVNKLHHTFNVTRVFVTADHGFIYQDLEIRETDKETSPGNGDISSHNRYEISGQESNPKLGYCFPLSATTRFRDGDQYWVTIPESINRYKKQGVGHQFVHGGGSLQELIIPVINSYRKTQAVAKKVRPIVTNESQLKIVSNILRLNLLQEKKVSRTEKELELTIGLYKDNQLVSNEAYLKMDSSSESPTDRIQKVELILNSSAVNESLLKLKVFDAEERLNPIIEIFVRNQTIIATDF